MGRLNKKLKARAAIAKPRPAARSPKASMSTSRPSKVQKRQQKKMQLRTKLQKLAADKEEQKATLKRQKTVITGDLRPMMHLLDELLDESQKKKQKKGRRPDATRAKARTSLKDYQQQMNSDLNIFGQVLSHAEFARDPFAAISTLIRNKCLGGATE